MTKRISKEQKTIISTEKDKYTIPEWTCRPPLGTHLDVVKTKQLLQVFNFNKLFFIIFQKLLIDEKDCYYFGRNPSMCDFIVEHASCSRVHAVLLYHKILKRFALIDLESSMLILAYLLHFIFFFRSWNIC